MGGTWPNNHEANPDTGVCLSRLCVLQNKAHTRKNVSEGGQNKVGSQGLVHVKAWKGGRDMVKACSKFGGRRASVRDTRLNKVVDTWTRKKGN